MIAELFRWEELSKILSHFDKTNNLSSTYKSKSLNLIFS